MPRKVDWPPADAARSADFAPAGWWHESEDGGKLVCDLCPRGCTLGPGKRGFCFVRQNLDGSQIVSTTYGRSTGFCIDPIEKKPLNQFFPGTAVLSFGTAGCNLGCKFCQNWSISKSRQVESLSEVADPETIAEAARQLECKSVAFTYNDPIIWAEYAIDTARACHALGVKTVAVTSGYIAPAARKAFFSAIDAANVDLKAFSEEFYFKLTSGHLEPVLDTLRWLIRETEVWVEITNLIIPDANDSAEELKRMCDWVLEELGPDVPLHFTAFHPDFRLTDRGPTPPETLRTAYTIARQAGLHYVYTGNVSDRQHQSTYCPGCGSLVIERDGYHLGVYTIDGTRCRHCGAEIAGRFEDGPGEWGPRRMPVRIADYARRKPPQPKGASSMPAERPESSKSEPTAPGHPTLSPGEKQQLFEAAGRRVTATVRGTLPERLDQALGEAGTTPLLGAFVSLKRAGQLRSCCGFLGESIPLHEAVGHAADRAAKDDPRFPPISPTELANLDMEVWLLWGLEPVLARGEDRVAVVTIGKHGLQIARGQARGLLLPGVATEHNLDARSFLEHVCRKAGLSPNAWLDDDTTLMTFEGYAIAGKLDPGPAAAASPAAAAGGPTPGELSGLAEFCRQNLFALVEGATPNSYLPGGFDRNVSGAALTIRFAETDQRIEASRVGLREELPLQASLLELARTVAGSLRAGRVDSRRLASARVGLTVFWDPAMHGTVAEPELEGFEPKHRSLLVADQGKWCGVFDPEKKPLELVEDALARVRFREPEGAAVCSLAVASTEPKVAVTNVTPPQPGAAVRNPAVAGAFYPKDAAELERALDDMLPREAKREPWVAAMVPHAGWIYSGKLAAEVLSRVDFPPQVIIFSPKHRPFGADWAIAPHETWSLPGRNVPSDPDLAARLAEAVAGMELDAAAHVQEHAIEVQLPIIARLAPESRVVGVAIHGGSLATLEQSADELAAFLAEMPRRPLLVISTDMNHYADDASTRKLDRMALDAAEALDPAGLYQTVVDRRISMCGMLPAVLVMETLKRLGSLSRCQAVGYATSADASGDTSRVVGYAGLLFN